jgi:hypothetical protein
MLDHERKLIERANVEKLLRQVEEGLAHSREIIAQINKFLAQRNQTKTFRAGGFSVLTFSNAGNPNPIRPLV